MAVADDVTQRSATLEAVAHELLRAYDSREPVAPIRDRLPDVTLDDAYAVQLTQRQARLDAGRRIVGHKVGLTSLAMQRQLGVDSPDFGFVTDDAVFRDGDTVGADRFIAPKVEPEFGFVLSSDLRGPGVDPEQARAATGEVFAALEIIDSRIADWDIRLVDTVADNASGAAIALGATPLDVDPRAPLDDVRCTLVVDGQDRGSGTGADVLGDPFVAVAWLANTLGERGITLEAGQIVLPGSFCAAYPVRAGSTATADFPGLGSVTIHF